MGRSIVTVQMSADASIGPSIGWYEPDGAHEAAGEDEVRLAGAMLLGRKTYEALAPIWTKTTGDFADRVNGIPKYVASTSLTGPLDWNATLIEGDLAERVRHLKAEHQGDLLTYGCGKFAFALVAAGLVDEVHFWLHPVVWSEADRPFHGLGRVRMRLKDSRVFGNGVVRQNYEPLSVER
ncbi:dihydrofolate reductase family protein [Phytohabitans sp. ZYX-F-186]|uniref:Dihydrofolate reductase family protein n=1 Tax=Phytohabitans maris TaxID=3071409 RepID=A0ABU0ZGC3_9ACTN|nr:dihydrofolate reductase family protein [Phytohabitans sp. ZYX-F-186]MDQ7905002.1 dihydrofolate reductase family protein [Phytohabitans sp. ZYX-F-186]